MPEVTVSGSLLGRETVSLKKTTVKGHNPGQDRRSILKENFWMLNFKGKKRKSLHVTCTNGTRHK